MSIGAQEIAFSGYAVTDFDRSIDFYQNTLGLKLSFKMAEGDGPQWAEFEIGSGTLAIAKVPDWNPSKDGCTVAIDVEDFDAAIAHLREAGVTFTMKPMDSGVCHMACIIDPDGNPLLIHKRHPQPSA
jgi:predicted enzyme related to lactoylglutathione lyase